MGILFLLFVVTPIVELWLLIEVGSLIGTFWTIALVLATGAAGAWLARREGLKNMQAFMKMQAQGVLPGEALFNGLAIFLGGALLLTPGIVTDVLGFALLVPVTRALIGQGLTRWLERRMQMQQVVVTQVHPGQGAPPDPWSPPPAGRVIDQSFDD